MSARTSTCPPSPIRLGGPHAAPCGSRRPLGRPHRRYPWRPGGRLRCLRAHQGKRNRLHRGPPRNCSARCRSGRIRPDRPATIHHPIHHLPRHLPRHPRHGRHPRLPRCRRRPPRTHLRLYGAWGCARLRVVCLGEPCGDASNPGSRRWVRHPLRAPCRPGAVVLRCRPRTRSGRRSRPARSRPWPPPCRRPARAPHRDAGRRAGDGSG